MVRHLLWEHEIIGSNPIIPTTVPNVTYNVTSFGEIVVEAFIKVESLKEFNNALDFLTGLTRDKPNNKIVVNVNGQDFGVVSLETDWNTIRIRLREE